jgi:hypothetical protein
MTRTKDLCHPETVRVAAAHQAEAEKIAAELAAIAATGMVLPGSITQRRTRCGRRNCACHADPPRLHGPYWQWTRKIAAKTICRWLSADQHRDYTPWIDNDRRLHELLARLEALGAAAFDADPRWEHQARRRPAQPEPNTPHNVGSTRLTCGQASARDSFPQASPKREVLAELPFYLRKRGERVVRTAPPAFRQLLTDSGPIGPGPACIACTKHGCAVSRRDSCSAQPADNWRSRAHEPRLK